MKSAYFYRRAASPIHIAKLIPALEKGEIEIRKLSKEVGMTYQNISQCLKDAYAEGLIKREKEDNHWTFEITDKGKALAELCIGIKMVIENWKGEETLKMLRKLDFSGVENGEQ